MSDFDSTIDIKILGQLVGEADEFDFSESEDNFHGAVLKIPGLPEALLDEDGKLSIGIDYIEGTIKVWMEHLVCELRLQISGLMVADGPDVAFELVPLNIHSYGSDPGHRDYHDLADLTPEAANEKIKEVIDQWDNIDRAQSSVTVGSA